MSPRASSPASNIEQLGAIHQDLANGELLPAQQLVDAGYLRACNLLNGREQHQVDVVGPIPNDHQWQAKAKTGFAIAQVRVDWDAQVVVCPQERQSVRWGQSRTARERTMIRVEFSADDRGACSVRPQRTRARAPFRSLTLQLRDEHEAIRAARRRQASFEFAAAYARRAGVEGSLSQGVGALSPPISFPPCRGSHPSAVPSISASVSSMKLAPPGCPGPPFLTARPTCSCRLGPNVLSRCRRQSQVRPMTQAARSPAISSLRSAPCFGEGGRSATECVAKPSADNVGRLRSG